MTCCVCGAPVKDTAPGVYREVIGWEKVRVGGGAHAIAFRMETGKLMCASCGERKKVNTRWKVHDDQETLM